MERKVIGSLWNRLCLMTIVLIARYVRKTSGWTFLHQAAFWNDAHACKLFIRFGASTKKFSNDGETPIDVAQKAGYSNVVELLVNAANSSSWTPVEGIY